MKRFHIMYDQYFARAVRLTTSYVHDEMVAEDIASEALLKLWHMINEKDILNPEHMLITMVKNKALDYLKHQQVHHKTMKHMADLHHQEIEYRISSLEACEPSELLSEELYEKFIAALDKLPTQTRQIFEMSRFQQLKHSEISMQTDLSIKSIEYHMSKALKFLRTELKDYLHCLPWLL